MQKQEQLGVQFGKYRVYAKLAVGGMAELFLARQHGSGNFHRTIVLKCVLPHLSNDPEYLNMFRDEASIMASLNHANIVQVYEFDESNGVHYIAMEYIRGQHFKNFRKRLYRRLPDDLDNFSLAAGLIADVAAGLHYAHTAMDETGRPLNLVHRDVSPTNLLLTYNGHVKIVDFGVAKAVVKDHHTTDGTIKGKYRYMSPEQIRGEDLDLRSDVFSLGIILYELSTNTGLFARASEVEMIDAVRNARVRRPTLFLSEYPPALEAIVMKALQADPGERYQTCEELQMDLEQFLRNDGHPYSVSERARLMQFFFGEEAAADRTGVIHSPLAPAELVRFLGNVPSSPPSQAPSWNEAAQLFDRSSHFPSSSPSSSERWPPPQQVQSAGAEFLSGLDEAKNLDHQASEHLRSLVDESSSRLTPTPMKAVKSAGQPLVEDSGVARPPASPLHVDSSSSIFDAADAADLKRRRMLLMLVPLALLVLSLGVIAFVLTRGNQTSVQSRRDLKEDILSEYKQRQYVEAATLLKKYQKQVLSKAEKVWAQKMSLRLRLGPRLDMARQFAAQQKYSASLQLLQGLKRQAPAVHEINALLVAVQYKLQQQAQARQRNLPTDARPVQRRPDVRKRVVQKPRRRRVARRRFVRRVRRFRRLRRPRRVRRVASAIGRRQRPVAPRPVMGMLSVSSTPSAVVESNGALLGMTPISGKRLKAGSYALVVRRAGYKTIRRQVQIRAGQTLRLRMVLESSKPKKIVARRVAPPPRRRSGRPAPALAFSAVRLKRKLQIRMFISDPRGIGGRHPTSRHRPICRKVERELLRLLGASFRVKGVTAPWCRAVLRLSRKSTSDYRTFYPRAVAYVAYRNLSRGRTVSRVAQILVSYANSNRFSRVRGY
jgi:serine/threonine-protein kinase